jgi:hypothetical protein
MRLPPVALVRGQRFRIHPESPVRSSAMLASSRAASCHEAMRDKDEDYQTQGDEAEDLRIVEGSVDGEELPG